jgi:transposase
MIQDFLRNGKGFLKKVIGFLSGEDKRLVAAGIALEYGHGGESYVAKEFNIGRDTIRKGLYELKSGIRCVDAFNMRGRKSIDFYLPEIKNDIKEIIDSQSQTDPKFDSNRLYTRLTTKEIRKQLIEKAGYLDEKLPTNQTLNNLINDLGYKMKKVQKVKPLKKIEETDKIFNQIDEINKKYKDDTTVLRLSLDAKAGVKIGNYSRNGKSRNGRKALDHDFKGKIMTLFGILNLNTQELAHYFTKSKATSDFIVDILEDYWESNIEAFLNIKTLILYVDNGPENSSRRTQFMKRIIELANKLSITIQLVYYPPYHSKYNPIERTWAALELHWNGDLLESEETVIRFAETMLWHQKNPTVKVIDKIYKIGVKLTQRVMRKYEKVIDRLKGLEDWFVTILPTAYNALNLS